MIDISTFDGLKKKSAKSFNEQKALIKKVMAGRAVACKTCGNTIKLVLPEQSESPGLFCNKGCTDIALDFER
jgi:hypothetical protein